MYKGAAIASSLVVAFAVGHSVGVDAERFRIDKKLRASAPLLSRAITSVSKRVIRDGLTEEEATRLMDQELVFISMTMQTLNR